MLVVLFTLLSGVMVMRCCYIKFEVIIFRIILLLFPHNNLKHHHKVRFVTVRKSLHS
jgi:hypothetical protein